MLRVCTFFDVLVPIVFFSSFDFNFVLDQLLLFDFITIVKALLLSWLG